MAGMPLHNQILLALILDLLLGDPKGFPHPVKGIGRTSVFLEKTIRAGFTNQYAAGSAVVLIVTGGTYLLVSGVLEISHRIDPGLETALCVFFIYTTLSIRSLYEESKPVLENLKSGNIESARHKLSYIVGRDTQNMDSNEITRACVETISENTSDGIVAPLFYAFLGGAPLAMAYKALNTLDSMFGYKSKEYIQFGWASAKLDDAANWIPARLTGILMTLATFLLGLNARRALHIMKRDGRKHPSPNAGIPEAALAGALNIRLGGPSYYKGTLSAKPWIGDPIRKVTFEDIQKTHGIMFLTSFVTLCFFELILLL